ncbi:MAG: sugar ABC transporter ATP-binding protein [Bacteroidia bacterium]|nr:sugar ABC transporter ATP-binding protein [Bacteroidia bacterium]
MDTILRMEKITKTFPGVKALDRVDFSCTRGEIHALLGENGAGKSTLIKILGGVYPVDSGDIYLDGSEESITIKSPILAQKLGISIVHQDLNLIPYMSVAENIFLGQESCNKIKCIDAKQMNKEASKILKRLNCRLNPQTIIAALDSTNQKMVQIAKSIVFNPKILVVDEPTAFLGTEEIESFFEILKELKERGTTVIYISHLLEEVFEIADRMTILKDGKLIRVRNTTDTTMDDIIRDMIGRELGDLFPPKDDKFNIGPELLSVTSLNLGKALVNVNLKLFSGEILGVAGLEGNGQNVLLKTIFGVHRKDSGIIKINQKEVKINNPKDAKRKQFALLTDKRVEEGLWPDLSVHHNLTLPILKKLQKYGFVISSLEQKIVKNNIKEYTIKTSADSKSVRFLSGGNQQKVVISKWLNNNPKIILLIEPTQGVDVGAKAEIYQLVRKLTETQDKGIILVSSDMLELLGLCDRILVMRKGEVVKELEKGEITEENILKAAVGMN